MCPGLIRSVSLRGRDDVRGCLFDDAKPIEFQLTDDRCLSRTRRAGDDEPFHVITCTPPHPRHRHSTQQTTTLRYLAGPSHKTESSQ
jgi:hypothetical protein